MNDRFNIDLEKIKKLERSIKSDMQKRQEQEKNNIPTSIVQNNFKLEYF